MDTPGATPQERLSRESWSERAAGTAWPAGWHVRAVDETGSTNADLLAAATAGAPHRTVLAAAHQTAGRGRLDRTWTAPPGANLLVSILFREVPAAAHELTQRVALAAARAATALTGIDVQLKWPNDLLVGDEKLAGVLAQAGMRPGPGSAAAIDHVVVGIGINVGWAPPGAACLVADEGDDEGDEGRSLHPLDLLRRMLVEHDDLPELVHPAYRDRLATLGRRVRVELPGGTAVEGLAVDVEPDGRLVVDDGGTVHRFDVGDIVHLRTAD